MAVGYPQDVSVTIAPGDLHRQPQLVKMRRTTARALPGSAWYPGLRSITEERTDIISSGYNSPEDQDSAAR